ncbi:hypothetical protein ACSS6W_002488 [Trichoderma asperelloides]
MKAAPYQSVEAASTTAFPFPLAECQRAANNLFPTCRRLYGGDIEINWLHVSDAVLRQT